MGKLDIQYSFETFLLWSLKLRLQKTGWLQYMPPFIVGVFFIISSHVLEQLLLLVRTSSYLIPGVVFILSAAGKLLLAIGIFDIVTLKFNIRPFTESIPKRPTSIDNNNENDDLCSIMQQRHSCRSFHPRRILDKDREELLQVANIASKDILGSSSSIRFEYVNSPLKVWPTVGAREFLVAIGPAKYDRMAMMDVGRSLQRVVIHATKMGIATCWIGPGADHDSVTAALKSQGIVYDSAHDHIVCVCAIGYKSSLIPFALRFIMNSMSRRRKPYNKLFFSDARFREPLDIATYPFDKYAKCYEAARWSPSSFNAQPTQCVGTWDKDTNTIRFDFFSSTRSRYYAPTAAGIWMCDWETACHSVVIKGRFDVLSQEERGIERIDNGDVTLSSLPKYNNSWTEESR